MFGTGVITFQKRSGKFLSDLEARYPQYGKINIKMLIEKHVRMFLISDDFFFQIICQIFCTCVLNNFELVLIY